MESTSKIHADYQNDSRRELDRTDPYGNETTISPSYRTCDECGEDCKFYQNPEKCWGETRLRYDGMMDDYKHLCEGHKRMHGSPQGYYMSEPSDHEVVQRMLGAAPDDELSNWGGEFTPNDDLKNPLYKGRLDEDPHYKQ